MQVHVTLQLQRFYATLARQRQRDAFLRRNVNTDEKPQLKFKLTERGDLPFGGDSGERASEILGYSGLGSRPSWGVGSRYVLRKERATTQSIQELGLLCFFAAEFHARTFKCWGPRR